MKKVNEQEEKLIAMVKRSSVLFPERKDFKQFDDVAIGWAANRKKMAMRGLVEPDCGGVNPLVRLTNRYTADRARVVEGVGSNSSREAVGEGRVSSQGLVR